MCCFLAFAWSYATTQLPAGTLVDRLGGRQAMADGLAACSAVQLASALFVSLPGFIAARVALGMGESPMFVGGARMCADRFPPARCATHRRVAGPAAPTRSPCWWRPASPRALLSRTGC